MNKAKAIEERAELLARVALTRRDDVAVLTFEAADLDLFASIYGGPVRSFYGFGVMVWGTEKPLLDEMEATRHIRVRWKQLQRDQAHGTTYSMPVIVLLFSMHNDAAYGAWISKPCLDKGAPTLEMPEEHEAFQFDKRSLDHVVKSVKAWYDSLSTMLRPQHASLCNE
jgi:hypothetical protein